LADSEETRLVAAYVLHQTLHLLSPFMPFITEELNAKLFGREKMLMVADWPAAAAGASADTGISTVIDIISEIRTMRSEMNVPLSAKPVLVIRGVSDEQRGIIDAMTLPLLRLARLGGVSYHEGGFEKGTARTSLQGMDMGLPLTGILDFDAERARLKKEIAACEAEAGKIRGKLNNPNFVERAPEAVVAENNRRLEEEQSRLDGLKAALVRLDTE
jgi:valyl-tRNA synthetase